MANQIVYPFGTGGRLPSGIGLVNDLKTGGVDNALTAEQGKIIGEFLMGHLQMVELDELTVSSYGLSNSKTWTQNGKHIVVPVVPGEKYTLTVNNCNSGAGNFYGLFTNAYTVPASTSASAPYVSGYNRSTLLKGSSIELTIPATCAYICLVVQDGSQLSTDFFLYKHIIDDDAKTFAEMSDERIYMQSEVDLTDVASVRCYLGQSKRWGSVAGNHIAIPVTPGEYIDILVASSGTTGGFYGFMTSEYTSPPTAESVAPYAYGHDRTWINTGTTTRKRVPSTAAYLIMVTKDGSGYSNVWRVWNVDEHTIAESVQDHCLRADTVVTDLTKGGTSVPLSAEGGKTLLKKSGYDGIPNGITKFAYNGAPVLVNRSAEHYVAPVNVSSLGGNRVCQGGACFGDYLFLFASNNTTCWVQNLRTKNLIQTISIPEVERGFVSDCHCNTVNFGNEYYDANDPFPLIYVSTGYNDGTDSGALVYRIVATTENDVTTYSLTLVQTLKLPGTAWTEFVTGEDGFCYLCYTGNRRIYKMNMPTLSQGDVTFNLEQALEVYQFTQQPAWFKGSRNQNRFYKDGKMYVVSGTPTNPKTSSSERSLFMVFDMATRTREVVIDLQDLGLNSEPETVFIWNGHICIAFRNLANVYALYFE